VKLYAAIQRQGLSLPVFALVGTSAICTALIIYRVIAGAQVRHAYLIWNLFLAWLPLLFALLAVERHELVKSLRDRKLLLLDTAWLLFFPNAPYIFTDLVHVLAARRQSFWTEMILILLCAMTGFLTGCLSLQLMHQRVAQLWGRAKGWLFVVAVSGLAGFGVYLGRFVRLNSWNVLTHPLRVLEGTTQAALNVVTEWQDTKFLILFSVFLLLGYVMLFALTQHQGRGANLPERPGFGID